MSQYIIPAALNLRLRNCSLADSRRTDSHSNMKWTSLLVPRGDQLGRAYVVRIRNTGNKKLETIQFKIEFESPVIEASRFADPSS